MSVCHPDVDWSCLFTAAELAELREDAEVAETLLTAEAFGWTLLASLTAYQVATCPITVRPCAKRCIPEGGLLAFPVATGGHTGALGGGGGAFNPHISGGRWLNSCGCRSNDCSCTSISEVILPGPVGGIESVIIDGVVLPPSAYRVDNGNRLVRQDGMDWPACQDMSKAASAAPSVAPATLVWPNGVRVDLTRDGDIVTAHVFPNGVTSFGTALPLPAGFLPRGIGQLQISASPAYVLIVGDNGTSGTISVGAVDAPPYLEGVAQWLADPIAPVDQDGTFAVSYYRGAAPNRMTRAAAGALAAEFYQACIGANCALPSNVVSASQQGVDYEFQATDFPEGVTGIKVVDALIRIYNPYKRKGRTLIASPDAPLVRTPTWSR